MGTFDGLLALQRVDTRLDQIRHRLDHLAEHQALQALEKDLARLLAHQAEAQGRRDLLAKTQRRLEDEVAAVEAKRSDVDKRLRVVTVPREAQSLSDEADALVRRQGDLEEHVLEVMVEAEPVDAELADLAAHRAELDDRMVVARARLAEVASGLDREQGEAQAQRAELAAAVPPALLGEYEALRRRLGGVAVTTIEGHICTGCHLTLPAVELERIRHEPADAIVYCEPCQRIVAR